MKYFLKRKCELVRSDWGGGSTAELFVYPLSASYGGRDFEFRISSATVEQSPSVFTALASYHRVLMPISAPLKLNFDNAGEVLIEPFESVYFEGGQHTVSHGVCTDVGVMYTDKFDASICVAASGVLDCANGFTCIYALFDNVITYYKTSKLTLNSGDFVVFETNKKDEIIMTLPQKNAAVTFLVEKK